MIIGVPKEIKAQEYRVGLNPAAVRELVRDRHDVVVETGAGTGIHASDEEYRRAGATIGPSAEEVFAAASLIIKVKEPQPAECALLRPHHILFTYLHLAPDPRQAEALKASGATCIAYETVTGPKGDLPLLTPMSEVAGRLAIEAGGLSLRRGSGGRGLLLGGVAGVPPARVLVLGGGVVGTQAARMAVGLGAGVTIIDRSLERLRELDALFRGQARTLYSTASAIETELAACDLLIGAVLIPGASAPKLVTREMLGLMVPGAVIVDVAIDQGGCCETSRPTTHQAPTYIVDNVVHYCVANMPGAVPVTSTAALNNATLPYVRALARDGMGALKDPALAAGLNVRAGKIVHPAVAAALQEH